MLASHGFLHEASSCWTDWTSPRVDDWDPFSHAPYNALDLSHAGSCETDQLVHEDVSDAARGHGAILSHPAILDRFCKMTLLNMFIIIVHLHLTLKQSH